MSRILISIILTFTSVANCCAQNKVSLLERINSIKSQTDIYYWGQYTHPNADTAKVHATNRLLIDVNLGRPASERATVEQVMPYCQYISIDRGNLKQCFVYAKITDIQGFGAGPAATEAPAAPPPFVPEAFVQRLIDTRQFIEVYKLLKSMQEQGQILQFGKLKDVGDYSSLDLILFDMQSQELVTILSPSDSKGKRTNMVSGTEDSLDNYPLSMTAVIWYIKN